ncbi:MAG: DUF2299 family protein [Desulfurococcaceae archaeon]
MRGLTAKPEELINRWLVEEGFIVRRLEAPPELRIAWGLDVNTPLPPNINFKVMKPADRPDRFVIFLGVTVSPEHRKWLSTKSQQDVLRFTSRLAHMVLSVCNDCQLTIQPSFVDPQTITIALGVFEEEVREGRKGEFVRNVVRVLNAYFTVVSAFNEEFPVIPQAKQEPSQLFI